MISGSRLCLHSLQVGEYAPEDVIGQDSLPNWHAHVHPPGADGLVENGRRLVSITNMKPTQIPRPFSLHGVWPVTMRAILIEKAAAFLYEVGATRERILDPDCLDGLLCPWRPKRKQRQKRCRNTQRA